MTQKVGKQLRFSLFCKVAPRNFQEEARHHLHHGEGLKSFKAMSRQMSLFGNYLFSKKFDG